MFTTELQLVRKGFLKKLLLCKISNVYNSRKNNRTDKSCMHSQLKGLSSEILPEGSVSFGRQGAPLESASTGAFLNLRLLCLPLLGDRSAVLGRASFLRSSWEAWPGGSRPDFLWLTRSPSHPARFPSPRKTENAVLKLEKTTSQ